jgi:hypothetical protein
MLTVPAAEPSERTSGEKICNSAFWMTIARPNVVSNGVSSPARRLRANSVTCRA